MRRGAPLRGRLASTVIAPVIGLDDEFVAGELTTARLDELLGLKREPEQLHAARIRVDGAGVTVLVLLPQMVGNVGDVVSFDVVAVLANVEDGGPIVFAPYGGRLCEPAKSGAGRGRA